jgi:hypothetical protein
MGFFFRTKLHREQDDNCQLSFMRTSLCQARGSSTAKIKSTIGNWPARYSPGCWKTPDPYANACEMGGKCCNTLDAMPGLFDGHIYTNQRDVLMFETLSSPEHCCSEGLSLPATSDSCAAHAEMFWTANPCGTSNARSNSVSVNLVAIISIFFNSPALLFAKQDLPDTKQDHHTHLATASRFADIH